jgi:aminobenzoyl-glutamate utilization protein B
MKQLFWSILMMISFITPATSQNSDVGNKMMKQKISDNLDKKYDAFKSVAFQIWDFAEVGFKEEKSSDLLQKTLKDAGFNVESGVAGMPTAFVATYGTGSPVIGILGEFDALPGLSQDASPVKSPRADKIAGHACGHHLFGAGSAAAAIEVKDMMDKGLVKGTIKFYGTPAEEGGSGKVYMVREGLFNDVDVVLHWHPGDGNSANPSSSLANISAKFRFYGKSAHAAGAPFRGRSALDGVESMDYMANMMREHVTPETRMHYVITDGGKAPNVVPDFAEVYYYVRHPDREEVRSLFERLKKAAEGAALGTETRMEYEIIGGVYNLLPLESLAKVMHANMKIVGGVKYTESEIEFAKKIQMSYGTEALPAIASSEEVEPYKVENRSGGSTDVGDISWTVPTVGCRTATWVPGTPAHSWQAVSCGINDLSARGMMVAAKTIAMTAYDLYTTPALLIEAKAEFIKARGANFKYASLLGDRPPALDYRD